MDGRAMAVQLTRSAPGWRGFAGGVPFPAMATEDDDLIGPNETAYRLELTPAQLKMTHTALKSLLDDFGHDEHEVKRVVLEVLAKLPDENAIRSIDIERGT
jgi:hypothetical protein